MRVENRPEQPRPQPQASFKQQLKKALAHPPKATLDKPPVHVEPKKPQAAAPRPTEALARHQKSTAAFNDKLAARRAEAEHARPEVKQVAAKIAGLLERPREREHHKAHQPERTPAPAPVSQQPSDVQLVQPVQAAPKSETLASQIERLVAHAELLARAEGPALSLALTEGRAAQLEVVRVGKGEVMLRLQARSPDDRRALAAQAKAIRAALAERGLRVRELTVR